MPDSLFDFFEVDTSNSYITACMRAGHAFAMQLHESGLLAAITRVNVSVHGPSGATERAQSTERALMLGLAGYAPEELDVWGVNAFVQHVEQNGALQVLGKRRVPFSPLLHIAFPRYGAIPQRSNQMRFGAHAGSENRVLEVVYEIDGG